MNSYTRITCFNINDGVNYLLNMDSGMVTSGILIDLKKAFHTVYHSMLLLILRHYGVTRVAHD